MSFKRALAFLGVVSAHLLLLNWLWTVAHQTLPNRLGRQAISVDRSPTVVFLLEPNAPAVIKLLGDVPHQGAQRARTDPKREAVPVYGNKVSNAAALSNTAAVPLATGEASAEVQKPPGSGLNLTLSREAFKSLPPSLAASSPFRGRLPGTIERKIADAAGQTGPWTEERLDNEHILLRRGTTCITLSRPEIAKIDPYSNGIRNLPWAAGSLYECH